jgi:hypothetical protein
MPRAHHRQKYFIPRIEFPAQAFIVRTFDAELMSNSSDATGPWDIQAALGREILRHQ